VHEEAVARIRKLSESDMARSIAFVTGQPMEIRDVLWDFILLHNVHHRGQLSLLTRQAGGRPSSVFGPTRETMPLPKAKS
jgi:uncharacterized damage-inducible protein DinB